MRKASFYLAVALALIPILCNLEARAQQRPPESGATLAIGGEVEHPTRLTAADLSGLPRKSVNVKLHDGSAATFDGVALAEIGRASCRERV